MTPLIRYALFALCLGSTLPAQAELPLVTDPRVPATPPGADVAAGYFTLTNSGEQPLHVKGVSSTTVDRVEMHRTQVTDDVARMQRQQRVTVEPGESLAFEHGGYHLMLMNLEAPLQVGDVIDITLDTSAGPVDISMPVVKHGMEEGQGQSHGEGHGEEASTHGNH